MVSRLRHGGKTSAAQRLRPSAPACCAQVMRRAAMSRVDCCRVLTSIVVLGLLPYYSLTGRTLKMSDQHFPLVLKVNDSTDVNGWLGDPLPPELIKVIVDELHDDQATLIACSLASSYFSAPCRQHLFSKIHLDQDQQQRIQDLLSILTTNPRLSINVRSLTLILHHDPDETILPKLLSMFPCLHHLSFGQRSVSSRVSWAHLPSKLRSAIFGLLWLDSLLEARIAYFTNFPLWVLCGRSSLAKLRLEDVFPSRDDSDNDAKKPQIIVPPLDVHSLSIALSHDTFRSHHSLLLEMQQIICPSSLRVLEISLFCTTQIQGECNKWVKDCSKQMDYHFPTECCNASTCSLKDANLTSDILTQ